MTLFPGEFERTNVVLLADIQIPARIQYTDFDKGTNHYCEAMVSQLKGVA